MSIDVSKMQFDYSFIGPSVEDQAVSLSDDGTTIIIDFFSFLFYRHSTRHTLHLHFNPD